jgi:hypothetical protein
MKRKKIFLLYPEVYVGKVITVDINMIHWSFHRKNEKYNENHIHKCQSLTKVTTALINIILYMLNTKQRIHRKVNLSRYSVLMTSRMYLERVCLLRVAVCGLILSPCV